MHGDKKQRHVHGVAADPGYRLVVIRGGDTEHAAIKCAPASRASGVLVATALWAVCLPPFRFKQSHQTAHRAVATRVRENLLGEVGEATKITIPHSRIDAEAGHL